MALQSVETLLLEVQLIARHHFILCLAKPNTLLCWYLVVLGYLFLLHPISIVMYIVIMYEW